MPGLDLNLTTRTLRPLAVLSLLFGAACATDAPTAPLAVENRDALVAPALPARSADAVVHSMGLNVHLSYFRTAYGTGWSTIIKPRLAALGIRHLRDAGTVVTDNSWMTLVYGRMKELLPLGIRFNLIMRPADGSTSYTQIDHFPRLLSYALPVIENFEGLNEHDISGRANWAGEVRTFQQALWATAKADSRTSGITIFGPSLGRPGNSPLVGDLSGSFNYGSLHPYPGGGAPSSLLSYHMLNSRPMTASKRFVVTESGYHTALSWTGSHPPVSEQAMARYIPRLYLEYFNADIPRTYLYELIDEGTSASEREQSFGLLRADGSEKPAFRALANLIALLKDQGPAFTPGSFAYALSGDTIGVKRVLLQKRDGRFYLALWHASSSYDVSAQADLTMIPRPLVITFNAPVARVRHYWPTASVTPSATSVNSSSVSVNVKDQVLLLEITR